MYKIIFVLTLFCIFVSILFLFLGCQQTREKIIAKEEKNEQSKLIESSFEQLVYQTFYTKEYFKFVTIMQTTMVGSTPIVVPQEEREVIRTEVIAADLIYYFDHNEKLISQQYFYQGTNTPIEHEEVKDE